ncbi:unnamed protein product [Symbiodinium natans]|uniref:Uncharacterized protein n=1 Tax=Symbiodinium natans TaxID=878477 RepID=A0A812NFG0_9DINO|nr:unnamed protein product [Symbiodinium natans]
MPTGSVLGRWDPLQGRNRQDFISEFINYHLQDKVRAHLLDISDEELGALGAHHFGDQAEQLEALRVQWQQKACGYQAASLPKAQESTSALPLPNMHFNDDAARQDFLQKHIHRKLHREATKLSDEALQMLGSLHFSDQPTQLGRLRPAAPSGASGREGNEAAVLRRLFRNSPGPPGGKGNQEGRCSTETWSSPPEAANVEWTPEDGVDTPEPPKMPSTGEQVPRAGGIPGLSEWLQELCLEEYEEEVLRWCRSMGAIWLEEVQENAEDLADHLRLRPLERRRLQRAVATLAT